MTRIRGFKLGRRFFRVASWIFGRRRRNRSLYNRLDSGDDCSTLPRRSKPIKRIIEWGRRLTSGAKLLCSVKTEYGYCDNLRVEQEPLCEKPATVPKGHLAVYVGEKDGGGCQRVLVPVIYINHPLFSDLLRDAEQEYGFNQEGGITIPCPFAEFERVKTRIDAGSCGSRRRARLHTWKRNYCGC
ncbi:Auxin-responsive protein SAUR36 [Linum perenne]